MKFIKSLLLSLICLCLLSATRPTFAQTAAKKYPVLVIALEFPLTSTTGDMSQHRQFPSSIVTLETDKFGTRREFNSVVSDRIFGANNSVSDYFYENSYKKVTLENAGVYGPYQAVAAADHYWIIREDACSHGWKDGHRERRTEAINHFIQQEINLRKAFDLSKYDTNKDGTVKQDELLVVIAFPQASARGFVRGAMVSEGSKAAFKVGKISWDLYDGDLGIIEVFLPHFSGNSNLGMLAHEVAHVIIDAGDMYEDAESLPNANPPGWDPTAPGQFSLMDNDSFLSHLDPMHKAYAAKWITSIVVKKDGYYNIRAAANYPDIYKLADPNSHTNEYFLVENRQKVGYDSNLQTSGLAIWHINESRLDNYRTAVEMEPAIGVTNPIQWTEYLWPCSSSVCRRDWWHGPSTQNSRWHDNTKSYIGVWAIPKSSSDMRTYLDVPGPGILVEATPDELQLAPNASGTFNIRLVNTGPKSDTFDLSQYGLDPTWASLSNWLVTLNSYQQTSVTLNVSLGQCPEEGTYSFSITGRSTSNSSISTTDPAKLVVKVPDQSYTADNLEANNSATHATSVNISDGKSKTYKDLTLHNSSDVDYFEIVYAIDKKSECISGQQSMQWGSFVSAFRPKYFPGGLSVTIEEEYCRSMELTALYSDTTVYKKFISSQGINIPCPTNIFKDQKLYVAVRHSQKKNVKYKITFSFSGWAVTLGKPLTDPGQLRWPLPPDMWVLDPSHRFTDFAQLRTFVDRELPIVNEYLSKLEQADLEHGLGQMALRAGQLTEAEAYLNESLALFRENQYPAGEADVLRSMAELYSVHGRQAESLEFFAQAAEMHQSIEDFRGQAWDRMALGRHYMANGDVRRALAVFQEALTLQTENGDIEGQFHNYLAQSEALRTAGSEQAAQACIVLAGELLTEIEDSDLGAELEQQLAGETEQYGESWILLKENLPGSADVIRYQALEHVNDK